MNTEAKPRDPRVDPRPGDVVEYRGITVEVQRWGHGQVFYRCADSMGWMNPTGSLIGQWRRWAAGATVVRVAEEK